MQMTHRFQTNTLRLKKMSHPYVTLVYSHKYKLHTQQSFYHKGVNIKIFSLLYTYNYLKSLAYRF